jgi:vacuolar-type H+-ATPase subunit F/Vma7
MSVFVMGDEDAVLGFALVGVAGKAVHDADEARNTLDEVLAREDVEILLITEDWAATMRERMDDLKMNTLHPVILEIPGSEMAPAGRPLRELVQEAIGIHLEF